MESGNKSGNKSCLKMETVRGARGSPIQSLESFLKDPKNCPSQQLVLGHAVLGALVGEDLLFVCSAHDPNLQSHPSKPGPKACPPAKRRESVCAFLSVCISFSPSVRPSTSPQASKPASTYACMHVPMFAVYLYHFFIHQSIVQFNAKSTLCQPCNPKDPKALTPAFQSCS